ncbi:MAG: methyltransferase domain-containing protein [Thermoanaerobaculaceae bacterium]
MSHTASPPPPELPSSPGRGAGGRLRALLGRAVAWALHDTLDDLRHRAEANATAVELLSHRIEVAGEQSRAEVERAREDTSRHFEDVRGDLSAVQRDVSTSLEQLASDQRGLSEGIGRLQGHLETRLDQALGEVADLRGAVATGRSDLQVVTGHAIPELQGRVENAEGRLDVAIKALQAEVEVVRDQRLSLVEEAQSAQHVAALALTSEVEAVRDRRLPQVEASAAKLHAAVQALLEDLERVRDERLPEALRRIDALASVLAGVQTLAEEVRDRRLPALASRLDVLVARLHEELAETAGLVDRLVAGEPLRVSAPPAVQARLPQAMLAASRAFADAFRGSEEEISARVAEHLELLRGHTPILDLGCGRGELLRQLESAGIEASGVDTDPAMVEACRRAGLAASESDAVAALEAQASGSLGGVVALHLVEHLPAAVWMRLVEAAARALRPGGVLLIESPNPDSLRVGAGLFWIDPTHHAPVHPDALAFVARAVGLQVVSVRRAHEFPSEQRLAREGQEPDLRALAERLDAWLSAPRDFVLVATRP